MKQILLVIATLLLLSACFQVEESPPLKIGLVLPLTGPGAQIGTTYLEGATLAVEDLNKAKVLDRKIELVVEDTGSEPKNAVTAMQKMIDVDGIKFFATIASSHAMALKPIAIENNVLLFADVAHPNITGDSPLIFRHNFLATDEAVKLAPKIVELNAKNVGILYGNDDYGTVFNKELVKVLEKKGIETHSTSFDLKGSDFRTEVEKVITDSDLVVVSGFGPAYNLVLKQVKQSDFKGPVVADIGFIVSKAFEMGKLMDGIWYVDFESASLPNWPEFIAKYKAKYDKEPASFAPTPYGSMELLVHALAKANSDDPAKVAETLHNIGEFEATYETIKLNKKGDAATPIIVKQFESKEV